MLLALAAMPVPEPAAAPARHVDLELAPLTASPERLALCVGLHASRAVELDLCGGADVGVQALSAHAAYRWRWAPPLPVPTDLGVGPALGLRAVRACPYTTCGVAVGPEGLVSAEAVTWLGERVGLTLQLDAGLALLWTEAAPGIVAPMLRFPARLLVGVAF